jgi:hypothetical protein
VGHALARRRPELGRALRPASQHHRPPTRRHRLDRGLRREPRGRPVVRSRRQRLLLLGARRWRLGRRLEHAGGDRGRTAPGRRPHQPQGRERRPRPRRAQERPRRDLVARAQQVRRVDGASRLELGGRLDAFDPRAQRRTAPRVRRRNGTGRGRNDLREVGLDRRHPLRARAGGPPCSGTPTIPTFKTSPRRSNR